MNFLKKKLKPLASTFTSTSANSGAQNAGRDLEDDLYDEYIVEAPPHPSELLALGVDPEKIDVNDPDKLRELYRKAKEEGRDKQTNSVLLAKQRQKEELEERKRTGEEWKFFDSLSSRVEQAVKDSQKSLEVLRDRSAVNKLQEPDYELRQTADEVFRPASSVKAEKGANEWVNFGDQSEAKQQQQQREEPSEEECNRDKDNNGQELDCFGCPKRKTSLANTNQVAVESLLEDLGIDLRTEEQRRAQASKRLKQNLSDGKQATTAELAASKANPGGQQVEVDPFDTSFLADDLRPVGGQKAGALKDESEKGMLDPFDTSYVNL